MEKEINEKANETIKELIDQNQIDSKTYKKFRALQESWYNTGYVPRNETQNLWETFRHHTERFYAFLHLDREFRDLDYKHNYEEKLKIIDVRNDYEISIGKFRNAINPHTTSFREFPDTIKNMKISRCLLLS